MHKKLAVGLLFASSISCSDSMSPRSNTSTLSSANHYVVDKSFGFGDILDKRLSLISKKTDRMMYTLLGDDEPILMAVASPKFLYKTEGSDYQYLSPENAVLFTIGPKQVNSGYLYSEIFLYGTEKAVGNIYYGSSGYPYNPYYATQLCTGDYEKTCTISFDQEKSIFKIEFNESESQ